MAAEAVGYDEFGNEVDAMGERVAPVVEQKKAQKTKAKAPYGIVEGGLPDWEIPYLSQEAIDRRGLAKYKSFSKQYRDSLPLPVHLRMKKLDQKFYDMDVAKRETTHGKDAPLASMPGDPDRAPWEKPEWTKDSPSTDTGTGTEVGDYLGASEAPTPGELDPELVRLIEGWDKYEQQSSGDLREFAKAQKAKVMQEAEHAAEKAGVQRQQASDYEREVRAFSALQETHRLAERQAKGEIEDAEEMYKRQKIDPRRAFKSVGSQVAAALAIAAGAFATGLSRGQVPNSALAIIDKAIERDIDAQKSEMRKSKDVLKNKHNVYAQMLSRFGREDTAHQMATLMGLKKAKMDLDTLLTKHKSQSAQVNGEVMSAAIEVKMGDVRQKAMVGRHNAIALTAKKGTGAGRKGGANDPLSMAQSVVARLPMLAQQFGQISKAEGWGSMMPRTVQDWIPGLAKASSYEDSRNLMAKEVVRAFDGGRPTEKDFQILAAVFPKAHAHKVVGQEKFRNVMKNLNTMIEQRGRLERGMLTKAASMAGFVPGGDSASAGSAMYDLAEKEKWETFRAE